MHKYPSFEVVKGIIRESLCTLAEATDIISKNSGYPVAKSYISKLCKRGVIQAIEIAARVWMYYRADVEKCVVKQKGKANRKTLISSDACLVNA